MFLFIFAYLEEVLHTDADAVYVCYVLVWLLLMNLKPKVLKKPDCTTQAPKFSVDFLTILEILYF
jgi:hypothetical protein